MIEWSVDLRMRLPSGICLKVDLMFGADFDDKLKYTDLRGHSDGNQLVAGLKLRRQVRMNRATQKAAELE